MKIHNIYRLFLLVVVFFVGLVSSVEAQYYGNLSLSQTNLSLSVGQTSNVTAYNNYGTLYVSSNSNQNVATAYASGNSVSIYGSSTGNATIIICQNNNSSSCGTVYVTVGSYNYGNVYNNNGINLSNITLPLGSSATITSSTYGNLYVNGNTNPNIASTSLSSVASGCNAGAQYSVTTGQPCYYYTSQTNNGSVVISALAVGTNTITLCQNYSGSNCSTIYVTVVNNYSNYNYGVQPYTLPIVPAVLGSQTCYVGKTLRMGMSGTDVYCLQTQLYNLGYLDNMDINSYFDVVTKSAVMNFQQDNYLYPDGVVGRLTRTKLFY